MNRSSYWHTTTLWREAREAVEIDHLDDGRRRVVIRDIAPADYDGETWEGPVIAAFETSHWALRYMAEAMILGNWADRTAKLIARAEALPDTGIARSRADNIVESVTAVAARLIDVADDLMRQLPDADADPKLWSGWFSVARNVETEIQSLLGNLRPNIARLAEDAAYLETLDPTTYKHGRLDLPVDPALRELLDDAYPDACPSHAEPEPGCSHCRWEDLR